ncbi:right-handed parallel beta-helix repeat-containing protein [Treponema socranskii]|uniref:right-handed parallel beta-helix repeat-containing protein n=1 Tax=Treponema socranskii TaxID=53419 RepID=UPI003D8DD5DF
MRTCVTVLFCAVSAAALLAITACKELFADIEEDFSYWASEPAITGFRSASPAQTSPAGVQCVPSASDAVITLTVHNPKNFSFIMPGPSGTPADIVTFGSGIHDASGTNPPAVNADYTLVQSAYDTLILTYKAAFLKRYEQSSANIGASIKLYSTDGRKFNQIYKFNLEANTPPPDPAPVEASDDNHIALFKTGTPGNYVLCFKVDGLPGENVPAGVPLHSDLTHVYVSKNGGAETPYPVTLNSGGFIITDPQNTAFIDQSIVAELSIAEATALSGNPQPDNKPSGPWVLYLKTDVPVGGATAKYGIRLFDGKLYSARAEQSIGKRELPAPKVFAHTGMDNTANSGVYTEAGATNASGNNDLYPPNTATYNGLSATNAIPVYSAYGEEVKLTIKKDAGTDYPAGVTVTGSVEKHSGDTVSGTASFTAGQSASVTLPSPTNGGGVAVYKVVFKATGEGFDDSTTRTLYYKVCREVKAVSGLDRQMWHILKEAIAHTNADGTVVVNGEIKATKHGTAGVDANWGEITVKKDLTIKKAAGTSTAVINADKTVGGKQGHRIFLVKSGTLTLENLTLRGGICPVGASGGGMYIKPGAGASLTDCRIIDCVSSHGNGGAVCTQGRRSLTRGSIGGTDTWEGNQAKYGGGIYVEHNGSCTLTETKILKNYADGGTSSSSEGKGGGIYVERLGTCSLNNVTAVQLNGVHDALPNKGAGAGIYVASEGICNIAGSTKIDEPNDVQANDVYLAKHASDQSKNAKLTVTAPLTGTHTVAKITPEDYTAGVTAVNAASGVSLSGYAERFKITDEPNSSPPPSTTSWTLKYNGTALVLKQATTVIPSTATWKTLKEAIEAPAVEDGDEFVIQSIITATGATDDHGAISVTKKITVKGTGLSPKLLDANKNAGGGKPYHRIFTVENGGELTLEDITLTGGKAAGTTDDEKCGGAIFVKAGCKAKLKNCIIKNCKADKFGGGICSEGELTLDGGTIGGSSAEANEAMQGGGICIQKNGRFTLKTATISGNKADYGGAVVVRETGSVRMESGLLTTNTVGFYGGGVYVDNSASFTMTGGEIKTNNANGGGGGVYAQSGTFTLSGMASIESNNAKNGGGIYVDSTGKLEIKGGSIKSNKATKTSGGTGMGGGVYVFGGDTHKGMLDMSGGSIEGNGAGENGGSYEGSGGGVYIDGGTFTTTGGEIKTNNAKNGGGVYAQGGTLTMTGCTLIGNTASNGGAIYAVKKDSTVSEVTIEGGTIGGTGADANKATGTGTNEGNGGGIYVGAECILRMQAPTGGNPAQGVQLIGNEAAKAGGGVYVTHGRIFITSCTLKGNKAVVAGGGVYACNDSVATIEGGTIGGTGADANKATGTGANEGNGGGISVTDSSRLTMKNGVQVIGNVAETFGGGVFVQSARANINSCTIAGNKAITGGGISAHKSSQPATVIVSGGTIGGVGADANKATGTSPNNGNGGGIYIGEDCTVTLQNNDQNEGCIVKGNTAENGGGVYVDRNSTFKMYDGTIKNNTSDVGKGVYVAGGDAGKQDGDFIMGGKACVGDWGSDGTLKDGNDVYLARNNNSGLPARIKIDKDKPITESKVACITPRDYVSGYIVVWMSDGSSVGAYTNKFTVTPKGGQTWSVDSDGKLKTP